MVRATKKKKLEMSFPEIMRKLKNAAISENKMLSSSGDNEFDGIADLQERVKRILGIVNLSQRKYTNMIFFVMYDIESNKVRVQIAKYLLKQGCTRVQHSIFLADLSPEKYEMIRNDLTEVQAMYDNEDSILIVPISVDYIQAMRIIGKSIDVDVIMKSKNTLFF